MLALSHTFGLLSALLYVCILVGIYALRSSISLYGRLSGRKACIVSISIVLFLLLIFGLIPQDGSRDGFFGIIGCRNMSRSPIFILALLFLATTLTLNTIEDIYHFSRHRIGVTCAHLGLSVILIAGLFGLGSAISAKMIAIKDVPAHYARNEHDDSTIKLPFELILRDFSIFEYSSDVILTLPDGRSSEITIAVNHPARVGSWWIYQSDSMPDTERGGYASIFKCVYSPMSELFRISLWLLLISAAAMVFFANFKPLFGKRKISSLRLLGIDPSATGIFKEKKDGQ